MLKITLLLQIIFVINSSSVFKLPRQSSINGPGKISTNQIRQLHQLNLMSQRIFVDLYNFNRHFQSVLASLNDGSNLVIILEAMKSLRTILYIFRKERKKGTTETTANIFSLMIKIKCWKINVHLYLMFFSWVEFFPTLILWD